MFKIIKVTAKTYHVSLTVTMKRQDTFSLCVVQLNLNVDNELYMSA